MNQRAARLVPTSKIDVVEAGIPVEEGNLIFDLTGDLSFSTSDLESFASANWTPLVYDALIVAASVEFADRMVRRPQSG
jgi:hypothetical protein